MLVVELTVIWILHADRSVRAYAELNIQYSKVKMSTLDCCTFPCVVRKFESNSQV